MRKSIQRGIAASMLTLSTLLVPVTSSYASGPVKPVVPLPVCKIITPQSSADTQANQQIYRQTYSSVFLPASPRKRVYGRAGGTLSFTAAEQVTTSGSLQTTASVDAGVVFANVSASVGATVGLSKTTSTTVGYTWKVPPSQPTGWIEMGSHGYAINWEKGYYGGNNCTSIRQGSGTLKGASTSKQFTHS